MSPSSEQEHRQIQELLGVYALDAVDKETARMVEEHLEGCVKCSIEVAQHHEVAGLLANSGGVSPEGLWDGIASHLDGSVPPSWSRLAERLGDDDADRPDRLVSVATEPEPVTDGAGDAGGRSATVVPIDARRRSRLAVRMATVVAAAAAVVALVFGLQVHHLHQQVSALQGQPSLSGAEQAALAEPSSQRIQLTSSTGQASHPVTVVLTKSGTGFVEASGLSSLPKDRTYQLWGVIGDQTISLGLLGSTPTVVPFVVAGNAPVTAFAITAEQAGGVVHSTNQPVVAGEVTA